MHKFIETIRIANSEAQSLVWHQARLARTHAVHFARAPKPDLAEALKIPVGLLPTQVYRCRITYGASIEDISFEPYTPKPLHKLALAPADHLQYPYKYAQRTALADLLAQYPEADEVLLLRQGCLSDTTYTNIALYNGKEWHTPVQPLLAGTQRAQLLATRQLVPRQIRVYELGQYTQICLFNAMMPWEIAPRLPISAIQLP